MKVNIFIIAVVAVNLVVWPWLAGWITWMVHLHRKFMAHKAGCDLQIALHQELLNDGNLTDAREVLKKARLEVEAMRLANMDHRRCPLWFISLRGRWNADYLQQARKQAA